MSFQDFTGAAGPHDAAGRLAALRAQMRAQTLDAGIVPRADAYQGEYVADSDARLRWLTGFSGSAGFAIVTADRAGVFVDGRYRVQVRAEADPAHFTPVDWPEVKPAAWLREALPEGGRVGFDPWLHTVTEIRALEKGLEGSGIALVPVPNPVDAVWQDRPAPPVGPARLHDDAVAGQTAAGKRAAIAAELEKAGQGAAVLTLPDSISWLLNIRGSDLPRNPVVQAFALIEANGRVAVFADPAKFDAGLRARLGNEVSFLPPSAFAAALQTLTGPVRIDPATVPQAVADELESLGIAIAEAPDPVLLPKARKNPAELRGMRDAHLKDAVAMARLLHWLDGAAPGSLTEIDVVRRLEGFRREAGIRDISFDTIAGSGPHGALPHYRVSEASNRVLGEGELLVLDSGGQYDEGTTDITRTLAIGPVAEAARDPYTRVLRGMIAISRARFPRGLSGRDIDPLARQFLWAAGMDYDHGTGHGVGAALCVHEGPARISRLSEVPLEPGMILSNEPGYYREGAFGIRIENLLAVRDLRREASPDGRDMLGFETLTWVPIETRLILPGQMSGEEVAWLDAYHAEVRERVAPLLEGEVREWLVRVTAPLMR
ncbi:M24 family metallopeptidase [Paracoccus sp. S-4012]|uniref:aminopeptidase P family protein n=1 Tax=Paracoccus sp. S-4012 TaxID=2665648 RepID=UPI0012B04AAA|nr:aminopeptidase P family protein [Paracoccus sp. S-4012]MRX49343.1 M24 family metallopeptidase [Paracoccus sp. S-4012]